MQTAMYSLKCRVFTWCIAAITLLAGTNVAAQTNAANKIPPFRILLTTGHYLQPADLDHTARKLLMYFDPTCDHCKAFTEDLLRNISAFGNTRIIMITYAPVNQVIGFAKQFNLDAYPAISVGTEGTSYTVQKFYKIYQFPFIALFDNNNTLLTAWRDMPSINTVLMRVKQ